jgi:NitT/TauT family transport system substrate-binding protein
MKRSNRCISSVLAGAAAGALALGFASASSAQETVVDVLTANEGTCTLFSTHAAREMGIYEDAGISVNLLASETTVPYVAFLSTGDAELVMLDSAQVYQMANSGEQGSVIYEVMQKAPEGIIVMADGPVKTLQDLDGATVGLASDRDQITTIVTLDSVGMSIDQVKTVVVGDQGPLLASALTKGDIQAFAGGSQDFSNIAAAGVPILNITPAAVSQNVGNSFAIWDDRAEEIREIVTHYLRGHSMANLASMIDPKAVASMCRAAVPEEWENLDTGWEIANNSFFDLNLRRTLLFGELQPDVWAAVQVPYVKLGELPNTIETGEFLDDSFIAGANDFTTAEVKDYINAWKGANEGALLP